MYALNNLLLSYILFKKYRLLNRLFPSCLSVSKRVQVQNLSYENEFDLHLNGLVSKNDLHMHVSH